MTLFKLKDKFLCFSRAKSNISVLLHFTFQEWEKGKRLQILLFLSHFKSVTITVIKILLKKKIHLMKSLALCAPLDHFWPSSAIFYKYIHRRNLQVILLKHRFQSRYFVFDKILHLSFYCIARSNSKWARFTVVRTTALHNIQCEDRKVWACEHLSCLHPRFLSCFFDVIHTKVILTQLHHNAMV